MRYVALLLTALLAILALSACGDDDDTTPSQSDDATAEATGPANTGDSSSGEDSVSIELTGQVSGSFTLSGMTCDRFLNSEDDSDDQYNVSLSGEVDGQQYTIGIVSTPAGNAPPQVSVAGGEPFGRWESVAPGTVSISEDGGEVDADVEPASTDPGGATEGLRISGSWTCNGGYSDS